MPEQERYPAREAEQLIRSFMARDSMGYGYLLDFYRRGARLCYAGEDGIVLKNDRLNMCYTGGAAVSPEVWDSFLVMTESEDLAKAICEKDPTKEYFSCTQGVYDKAEPPCPPEVNAVLRPLTEADLDFVVENYHHPSAQAEHIRGRIRDGMIGAEVDGQLAGFIGVHEEGAMGLLEVLPQFRRRGLAEALEGALIRQLLEQGKFPYCHIRVGNTASERLQEKLGLTLDRSRLFYWVG